MPSTEPPKSDRPFQFTLRQLFFGMGIVSIGAALLYWLGPAPGTLLVFVGGTIATAIYFVSKRRFTGAVFTILAGTASTCLLFPNLQFPGVSYSVGRCHNNLRTLALALLQYHDDYGSFPPAYIADENGKPMHSWRVLLLPYVDQRNLYRAYHFDEPWDGPNNRALAQEANEPRIYECPRSSQNGETTYVAVMGPQTMWPGEKSTSLSDVKDGPSNTIMLVEVHNSGIHWMEPRDMEMSQMSMTINSTAGPSISSDHMGGWAHVVFVDGDVRAIENGTQPAAIRAALTIAGGEKAKLPVRKPHR
jgi:hypothetical protein